MPRRTNKWTMDEAASEIREVFEAARLHGPQTVFDPNRPGEFTVSFTNPDPRPDVVEFLLKGGPE